MATEQDSFKAEFEIKEREALAKFTREELLERCIAQSFNNANLANALINTARELNRIGDVFAEYGVACKQLAKIITPTAPKTVEEQKRVENTVKNQNDGFVNRQQRRQYEKMKQEEIKKLG